MNKNTDFRLPFHSQSTGKLTMTPHAAYVEKMQLQLDKLAKKMDTLESTAHHAKEEAHLKYKEEMSQLRQQSKVAAAKLAELTAAGEDDSWQTMVVDMEKMHDAITHSFFALFEMPAASDLAEKSHSAGSTKTHKKA
jgi:hypothetical protein